MTTGLSDIQLLSGATKADGLKAIAHCNAHEDEPVVVWRVDPEKYDRLWKAEAPHWVLFPCCTLCRLGAYLENIHEKAQLRHTLYILGKKNIYNVVLPYDDAAKKAGCNRCSYRQGVIEDKRTAYESLRNVSPISSRQSPAWVEDVGNKCPDSIEAVKIRVPQKSRLNYSNKRRGDDFGVDPFFAMYVSNSEEACTLISNAVDLAYQPPG
ncbi:unnamed protein product [Amoebophrya sp. A120]|nr:unnamed protein product [Amoebophrya sp. A120]|eukprot:GSA120T00018009001.1